MSELSPAAQALIDAARGGDEPTPEDRARVRAGVLAQLGLPAVGALVAVSAENAAVGASVGSAAGHAAHVRAASEITRGMSLGNTAGVAAFAKWALGVALLGGVGTLGYMLAKSDGASEGAHLAAAEARAAVDVPPRLEEAAVAPTGLAVTTVEAAGPEIAVASAPTARAEGRPKPGPAGSSRRRVRRNVAAPSTTVERAADLKAGTALELLQEEKRLLSLAQRARQAGDPIAALRFLEEHSERFANGILVQERAAAMVLTYCDLGNDDRAISAAQSFLKRWPESPLAERVRSSCARR